MVPKRYFWGTHRAIDPHETIAKVWAERSALGITRLAHVTGLDFVGIPTTMAVRPASRNLSVAQGKGLTDEAAAASGLMEAVESFCAEEVRGPTLTAAVHRLGAGRHWMMPEALVPGSLRVDEPISWTEAVDEIGGGRIWTPSAVIFADLSSSGCGASQPFIITTNGLAAGNCRQEALLHAVCELVERDAIALWRVKVRHGRAAPSEDLATIPGHACQDLLSRLDAARMRVEIWDVTSDLETPCFMCAIDDADTGRPPYLGRFLGSGCHPSADVALCRAICEAAQSRLTFIVGARDDISPSRYRWIDWKENVVSRVFESDGREEPATFEDRSFASADLESDLVEILRRMERCGVSRLLVADLPCPIQGISCVRAIAPDLEGLARKPGYRPGGRALRLENALA